MINLTIDQLNEKFVTFMQIIRPRPVQGELQIVAHFCKFLDTNDVTAIPGAKNDLVSYDQVVEDKRIETSDEEFDAIEENNLERYEDDLEAMYCDSENEKFKAEFEKAMPGYKVDQFNSDTIKPYVFITISDPNGTPLPKDIPYCRDIKIFIQRMENLMEDV